MQETITDRLETFEACFNFRDLGGYSTRDGRRVRWNALYRADSLHRFSSEDLNRFKMLGVKTVIDLRAREEIVDFGRLPEGLVGVRWHHCPIIESMRLRPGERAQPAGEECAQRAPGENYFEFLGSGVVATSVLSLIAESPGPAVFHCTSGKDRTGMIAAMVLDLLGVSDEVIAEDYVLTRHTRSRSLAWIEENEPDFAAFLAEIPPERRAVRPEVIIGFLERLRAMHGSVEALVLVRGMKIETLDGLRKKLLE